MKLKLSIKIISIFTLGLIFTCTIAFSNDIYFYSGNNNKNCLNNIDLRSLKVSEKIYINGTSDWIDFKNGGNCIGVGTYSDPYLIENLLIDGGGSESCIWIENSNVYFKIENCTLYNSGIDIIDGGIKLYNVENGIIMNNNIYNNFYGIYAEFVDNCIIIGNSFNNYGGIKFKYSNNNLVYLNNLNDDMNLFYMESTNRYFSQQKINYIYNGFTYTNYLGNYWNDYDECDNNNDGIGDLPVIFYDSVGEYVDRYPLIASNENYEIICIVPVERQVVPGFNLFFLICMICFISTLSLKKFNKFRKTK